MTVTLELKPEIEARVVEQAVSRGVAVEDFLESVIEDSLNGREGSVAYRTLEEGNPRLMNLPTASRLARPYRLLMTAARSYTARGMIASYELSGGY